MATQIITATFHAELMRPDDLLNLRVDGINLHVIKDENRGPLLTVANQDHPAFLRFTFAPQTIAESAFFEAALLPGTTTAITTENIPGRNDRDATHDTLTPPGSASVRSG